MCEIQTNSRFFRETKNRNKKKNSNYCWLHIESCLLKSIVWIDKLFAKSQLTTKASGVYSQVTNQKLVGFCDFCLFVLLIGIFNFSVEYEFLGLLNKTVVKKLVIVWKLQIIMKLLTPLGIVCMELLPSADSECNLGTVFNGSIVH